MANKISYFENKIYYVLEKEVGYVNLDGFGKTVLFNDAEYGNLFCANGYLYLDGYKIEDGQIIDINKVYKIKDMSEVPRSSIHFIKPEKHDYLKTNADKFPDSADSCNVAGDWIFYHFKNGIGRIKKDFTNNQILISEEYKNTPFNIYADK